MADILIVDDNVAFQQILKRILPAGFLSLYIREAAEGIGSSKRLKNKLLT